MDSVNIQIPCGKTMGHGYGCEEHTLCDQCRHIRNLQFKLDAIEEEAGRHPRDRAILEIIRGE